MKIIYAQIALAVVILTAAGDANRAKSKQNLILRLFKRDCPRGCKELGEYCNNDSQ